ncbi:ABC transporter [Streptomyces sp. DSM 15324]|uniref:ABC transporter n=1 Tax=Streptomyces sp. DSM 15324 TaxID=1739111 RepID=UPI0018FEC297|nr:ABC transporter [Streptomyces sp. DSM 15324]
MRGVEETGGMKDDGAKARADEAVKATADASSRPTAALLRPLLVPVWRTLPRRALTIAGAVGLLLAASTRLPDHAPGAEPGLAVLRLTALSGALGLAFLLDDPARNTSATTPVARPLRTVLRLAMVLPLTALWWTTALLLVPSPTRPPLLPVTLQAAATTAAALALATLAVRFSDSPEVGRSTAICLLTASAVAVLTPNRWGLLATPSDPWWEPTQLRWASVLAVTLAVCALWTREPLGPGRALRRPGSPGGSTFASPSR